MHLFNQEHKPSVLYLSILVVSPTVLLMVGFDVTLKVLHRHMFALGKRIDPLPHSTGNPPTKLKINASLIHSFNVRVAFEGQVLWDLFKVTSTCQMRLSASDSRI